MIVEILFTCWNRLAYTQTAFALLKLNTDWRLVSRLVVYDDGSEDGTREWITQAGMKIPVPGFEVRHGGWRSLGATMNDFIALTDADRFVKIDNDIAVPPGWLERLTDCAARNPDVELLGMEAGWTGAYAGIKRAPEYRVTPAKHIGGVGLMQTKAFVHRKPIPLSLGKNGRAGFTIWQHRYHLPCGWITPDLPAVQLDRIPAEPWRSLAFEYAEKGWSRREVWAPYTDDMHPWWDWIPKGLARRVA